MKRVKFFNIVLMLIVAFSTHVIAHPFSSGKKSNKDKEWIVLLSKGMEKWMGKIDHKPPASAWKMEDGVLSMNGRGGDIITKQTYSSFELVFEFKLTKAANSGIKYFVNTVENKETGKTMVNGPEYQIIDDYNYGNIKDDPHGASSSGALYLFYPPKNKKLNPHGEWNNGRIVARGNKVEHWLNGIKVVSYKRGSKDFLQKKATTKFKNDIDYGEQKSGHIMLTDHNDKVFFRNIKIRKL